jgi:hypothetical protein
MRLINFRKNRKGIALMLLTVFISELFFPTVSFALTGGPGQPEFSSFEPVATTNMVNEFSGDFTYNLPVLEVPGPHGSSYAMSLSYHSGTTPEEEASWVGYGWTLNPGAINRGVRGFPDDYNGSKVTYHNKVPANWTISTGAGVGGEFFSFDVASASAALRYNNYRGFGYTVGAGVTMGGGVVSLGLSVSDGNASYSLDFNPAQALINAKVEGLVNKLSDPNLKGEERLKDLKTLKMLTSKKGNSSSYGIQSFADVAKPTNVNKYTGIMVNVNVGVLPAPTFLPAGFTMNTFGSMAYQFNQDKADLNSFGYMYAAEGEKSSAVNRIMDYAVEKETPYSKKDVFLGIPFNNADNFYVSGEGVVGGFRLHNKKIGQFAPNHVKSETSMFAVGGEVEFFMNFGGGGRGAIGYQTLEEDAWKSNISSFASRNDDMDEPVFFRFTNDLGGSWEYDANDRPIAAKLKAKSKVRGSKSFDPDVSHLPDLMNNGQRGARSSYIGYHTNKEISEAISSGNRYRAYSLRNDLGVNRNANNIRDGIGEFAVFNEDGMRYVYGLPVYAQNEKSLQYGTSNQVIDDNYRVFSDDGKTLIGEEKLSPYATSFLLTEITTSDYVDRKLDGPTDDDFGGFTKFSYEKIASNYKWRAPYNGLIYHRNSLSDSRDDLGSMNEGEKEIYLLKTIETKTHKAIFITSNRNDGLQAAANAMPKGAKGTASIRLKKLDKIELYKKNNNGNDILIKTVNFTYYPNGLCKGLPNTINTNDGKLALKEVWFEHHGISRQITKTSPYEFIYQYPNYNTYPLQYRSLGQGYNFTAANQDPNYSPFALDAWGNYQAQGVDRFKNMLNWVKQTPTAGFDPAAWQLKVIKLPSGGQIHVQYEQKDYGYVQDQIAHVMVSLSSRTGRRYFINTSEIGVNTDAEKKLLERLIRERYVTGRNRKKMYFKFLYRLLGSGGAPDLRSNNCNAEYITGYVNIKEVGFQGGNIYVELDNSNELPEKVCKDFVMTQRAGMISAGTGNCNNDPLGEKNINFISNPTKTALNLVTKLAGMAETMVAPGLVCSSMNNSLSYLRVPMPLSKKGGGIRVKRLLMFDQGFEGDPVLYGNEYDYNTLDVLTGTLRSSGVATNEPASIREENILVDFIKRKEQLWEEKIISGKDRKQSEGPIGESVYPGASIGYAKVTIKNIHSGATNTGFSVREFFTAKDFPVRMQMTPINSKPDKLKYPGGLINYSVDNLWMSQGFSFVLNQMHGQVKRIASYGGDPQSMDEASLVSEQRYEYFRPGEKIPVMSGVSERIERLNIGKEVDITFAQKSVKDNYSNGQVEFDVDVGFLFVFIAVIPIPFATAVPTLTKVDSELYTHATSKVVRYPAVVKKVTNYQDGIVHVTENLAFDKFTGVPVSIKSYDDFSGTYLIQHIPASWQYKEMGPMYATEKILLKNLNLSYQKVSGQEYLSFANNRSCLLSNTFVKGDLLELGNKCFYHVDYFDYFNDRIRIVPSRENVAVPSSTVNNVRILRSGRNNLLKDQAGQITFHSTNSDIRIPEVSGENHWIGNENDFVSDLNTKVKNVPAGLTKVLLPRTYEGMNMESLLDGVSYDCITDARDVQVKNVQFYCINKDGEIKIQLISFEVKCEDSQVWIKIDNDVPDIR